MDRRTVLQRGVALGSTVGLAGCLSTDGDDGDDSPTPTQTDGDGAAPGTDTPTDAGSTDDTPTGDTPTPGRDTPTADPSMVGDRAIETTRTYCNSGDAGTASVSFDAGAERLAVDGTIRTSDPCHEAVLQGVVYDPEADVIVVTVSAAADDSGACMQCIGAVDYHATVEMPGGLAGTVVVRHASMGETSEVLRETVSR